MNRQESLDSVCKNRGLPNLKVGAFCEVDGMKGVIVGGNYSSNLDVVIDGNEYVSNCHPAYKMRIFNSMGGVCYESDDLYTKPCEDCGAVQPIECETEHACPD